MNAITRFDQYRPRPGHPDWTRLSAEASDLAAELLPTLERPRRGPARARRAARAWTTALSNFATNRRRHRQGRWDLLPMYFIWTALRSCNFACTYCDDHRGRKYPDLPTEGTLNTEQGLKLLRVMRTGTSSVYFAGGEPLLRKDLPVLVRAARDMDYHPIVVNTNASIIDRLLRKAEWKTFLADVDILVVSLDGLDLEDLSETWVTRKPQDVLRNLLLLKELAEPMGVKLLVNSVVRPGRLQDASDVLDLATDLGIWFTPVPMNEGPRAASGLLQDPAYRSLAARILAAKKAGQRITGSRRMNHRLLHGDRLSCRNTLKPHVDFDGRLAWPCKASVNLEPLWIDVLQFDDLRTLYEHASTLRDPTNFHGQGPEQCGADCNWAQNYTTDEYAHGLDHPTRLVAALGEFIGRR